MHKRKINSDLIKIGLEDGSVSFIKQKSYNYTSRKKFICQVLGEELLVHGGVNGKVLGDLWLLNLIDLKWEQQASKVQICRAGHCSFVAFKNNNKVATLHDSSLNKFNKPVKINKSDFNEGVYFFGGFDGTKCCDTVGFIGMRKGKLKVKLIETKGSRPQQRVEASFDYCPEIEIAVLHGGKDNENDIVLSDFYLYNLSLCEWTKVLVVGTRPYGRFGHSTIYLDEKIFILGGINGLTYMTSEFYILDLSCELNRLEKQEKF